MISDVILGQPKKAASLVFLIFGYILASYIVSPIDLVFEQKVPAVIVAGGVFSAFLFYVKPVDRSIKFFLTLRTIRRKKKLEKLLEDKKSKFDVYGYLMKEAAIPPHYLNSNLLAEEMAKINGAVFFSLSLFLASRLLSLINLHVPFEILVGLAVLMLVIAVWEIWSLFGKIVFLNFYYLLHRIGEPSLEFNKAISNNEWVLASELMRLLLSETRLGKKITLLISNPKRWAIKHMEKPKGEGGICLSCESVIRRVDADSCPMCGSSLLKICASCGTRILIKELDGVPRHCALCGHDFFGQSKNTDNKSPHIKKKIK